MMCGPKASARKQPCISYRMACRIPSTKLAELTSAAPNFVSNCLSCVPWPLTSA